MGSKGGGGRVTAIGKVVIRSTCPEGAVCWMTLSPALQVCVELYMLMTVRDEHEHLSACVIADRREPRV